MASGLRRAKPQLRPGGSAELRPQHARRGAAPGRARRGGSCDKKSYRHPGRRGRRGRSAPSPPSRRRWQATTSRQLRKAITALDERWTTHLAFARKSTVREYSESIGVAVAIALFLRAFVVEAFKIPSGSMIPTLEVGDHIFVNKFIYGVSIPFTNIKFVRATPSPSAARSSSSSIPNDQSIDFIKRVVGPPGDTVEVQQRGALRQRQAGPARAASRAIAATTRRPAAASCSKRTIASSGWRRWATCATRPSRCQDTAGATSRRRMVPPHHRVRDGRQPRQLVRLALLGRRSPSSCQGQGADRLVVTRRDRGLGPRLVVQGHPLEPLQRALGRYARFP